MNLMRDDCRRLSWRVGQSRSINIYSAISMIDDISFCSRFKGVYFFRRVADVNPATPARYG
jgi:hypothetical protein